jgi:hypothetical protein
MGVRAFLALSLMAGFVAIGWRALTSRVVPPRAAPRAIAAARLVWRLIALPWIYLVPWRPASLPPTRSNSRSSSRSSRSRRSCSRLARR